MKSVEDYLDCLDSRTTGAILLKIKPKKEFVKTLGPEDLYDKFQNTKVGYIKVHKISDNPGIEKNKVYEGVTGAFGEGFAVWISSPSSWFHTSNIKSIDWKNNTFETLNSTYAFEFEELEYKDFAYKLASLGLNSVSKRHIKGHEC